MKLHFSGFGNDVQNDCKIMHVQINFKKNFD